MNAVILVGGGGTRLRPLTYAVPKPLLPILNRPLIVRLIEHLQRHGVDHVVLAAAAGDRRIEALLGDGASLEVRLSYSYEETPLGSGLAVKQAAHGFDDAFFVCNGDVITDLDLSAMARRHREAGATLSISLAAVAETSSYGIVELADGDRITRFVEKPHRNEAPSSWANAGTWIFEPEVLDHISEERMDGSLERLAFPSLIADGFRVQGFPADAYWMDVGTSERYMQLHRDILAGRIDGWPAEEAEAKDAAGDISREASVGPRVVLGRGCRVGGQALLQGPSVLGERCDVRERARVEHSVVWEDCSIGAGALVRDSIVGAGVSIGDGAIVEGAVIANGARIKHGARLTPGARLEPDEVVG